MSMIERINSNPKILNSIITLFFIFFILNLLFKYKMLPSYSLTIGDIMIPPFQSTMFLIVFLLILIINHFVFVRRGHIRWHDLGFNRGKNGLLYTVALGLFGGFILAIYSYILIEPFYLETNAMGFFIEKCIFASIWEEFFNRALLLIIFEMAIVVTVTKLVLDNPKYKNQISDSNRKYFIYCLYLVVLIITGYWFVLWHGYDYVPNIFLAGILTGFVYLKTRSIIAPIIVHSMSNFVTGGFLFLMMRYFAG